MIRSGDAERQGTTSGGKHCRPAFNPAQRAATATPSRSRTRIAVMAQNLQIRFSTPASAAGNRVGDEKVPRK